MFVDRIKNSITLVILHGWLCIVVRLIQQKMEINSLEWVRNEEKRLMLNVVTSALKSFYWNHVFRPTTLGPTALIRNR